ncbi:hypothetical protein CAXC1_320045 [Candidatus Xenohaliotis californiensis]|uniref:Uncharacterized protein n=1 Tax=Candidatus Xenohaliotis californiensis TaxID=84677 RepID=A0ABP0EWR1_9RICK|nr:hypothetical protein CAXC1_320045 [Candidatus Xenohaliotis californiensis]
MNKILYLSICNFKDSGFENINFTEMPWYKFIKIIASIKLKMAINIKKLHKTT